MADVKERMVIEVTEQGVKQTEQKIYSLNKSLSDHINKKKAMIDAGNRWRENMAKQREQTAQLNANQQQLNASYGKILSSLQSMILTYVSLRAVIGFISKSYSEYENYTKSVRLLTNQIEMSGRASQISASQLMLMADGLQKISNYGNSEILEEVYQTLIKFERIPVNKIGELGKAIVDYASYSSKGLKEAAEAIGRAMEDPATASRQLRTAGILLTKAERELLAAMVEVGDYTKAQGYLFDILKGKYEGSAEAAQTAANKMKNAWSDFAREFGSVIAPAVNGALNSITYLLERYQRVANYNREQQGIYQFIGNTKDLLADLKEVNDRIANADKESKWTLANLIDSRKGLIDELSKLSAIQSNNLQLSWQPKEQTEEQLAAIEAVRKAAYQKSLADISKYYETVQFLDANYYEWKSAQIAKDINAMSISTAQKNALIDSEIAKLDELWDVWSGMAALRDEITKNLELNIAGTRFKNSEDLAILEEVIFGKQGTEKIKEDIAEVTTAWQEFANDMQNVMSGQVANALNIMILSHESAFAKLQSIMNSFVNAMISELNRYIAKLMIAFLFQSILGIATGGSTNAATLGSAVLKVLDNGGTGGSVQLPQLSTNSTDRKLDSILNNQSNRPVDVKVYVRPEEISRAAEIGNTLRYITGAS